MTAITFPLKRFPGQKELPPINLGGYIFHPIITLIVVTIALILSVTQNNVLHISLLPYYAPLIFSYATFIVRNIIFKKNLVEITLKDLKITIEEESKYYKNMAIFGLILSIIIGLYSFFNYYNTNELMPVTIMVFSVLSMQLYIHTINNGIFTRKKLFDNITSTIIYSCIIYILYTYYPNILFIPYLISLNNLIININLLERKTVRNYLEYAVIQ